MRVLNDTAFPALFLGTEPLSPEGEPRTAERIGMVILKSTFEVDEHGTLTPAADPLPILVEPLDTPFGRFHGDAHPRREGVDLCVLGTFRSVQPVREARVRLSCGEFRHGLRLYGERRWLPDAHNPEVLVASEPALFDTLPLGYAHAYGGAVQVEGEAWAFPANPMGVGFYRSALEARGGALPRIEAERATPITRWDQQGPVAGWGPYPMSWALRAEEAITPGPSGRGIADVSPRLYNNAHPDLVVPYVAPGEVFAVEGLDTPFAFRVPPSGWQVEVQLGTALHTLPSALEAIYAFIDTRHVCFVHRTVFRYTHVPEQMRGVVVGWSSPG